MDQKIGEKRIKFIITAVVDHIDGDAPPKTEALSCVANKIYHEDFTIDLKLAPTLKAQLQHNFNDKTFYDKSFLANLRFEDGVADETEEL